MCASRTCGGGLDFCCERDCANSGGPRPCGTTTITTNPPTIAPTIPPTTTTLRARCQWSLWHRQRWCPGRLWIAERLSLTACQQLVLTDTRCEPIMYNAFTNSNCFCVPAGQ